MDRQSKLNSAFLEVEDNKYLNQLYRAGYQLDFAITREVSEALNEMYAPHFVKPGTKASTDHPIAAAHQRIAYRRAYDYAKTRSRMIEIGPNASNFMEIGAGNNSTHACTLWSARDQQRHATAAASVRVRGCADRKFFESVQLLASGIPSEKFCIDGFQNCIFQSPHAIAVHSLYDISFADLAYGMNEHGTINIRAWMHFPIQALDLSEWTDHNNRYQFFKKDGKIYMSFLGDYSFGYIHDENTWMNYLTVGGFDTPYGFSLIIEKVRHNGSQWELNIQRTTTAGTFFYRIPNTLSNLIKVPNFTVMAKKAFCNHAGVEYIVTDARKVRKLYTFLISREQKGFSLDTAKAFARSLLSEIRFGGAIVERNWDLTPEQFSDLVLSVFILVTLQRRREREVYRMAIDEMDKLDETQSFFMKWLRSTKAFQHVMHFFHSGVICDGNCRSKDLITLETENLYGRAALSFFQDVLVENSVKEYGHNFSVSFTPTLKVSTPTIEDAHISVKTVPTQVGWFSELGLKPMPPANGEVCDFDANSAHTTMVLETKNAADQAEGALQIALRNAYDVMARHEIHHVHLDNIVALTGVPGSGKSKLITEVVIPAFLAKGDSKVLVITPTNALTSKYAAKLAHAPMACCTTTHKALPHLKSNNPPGLIIIDEAFMLPFAYINFCAQFAKVIVVGDPNQIEHVDFSNFWTGYEQTSHYIRHVPEQHMKTSHRIPRDISKLNIFQCLYPDIQTTSNVVHSMEIIHGMRDIPAAKKLTFTQFQKNLLGDGTSTVAEAQGETFEAVLLHYGGTPDERSLLTQSYRHVVTSVSRHTKKLYLRDVSDSGTELLSFITNHPKLNILLEKSNVDPVSIDLPVNTTKMVSAEVMPLPDIKYATSNSTESHANEILQAMFPLPSIEEHNAVQCTHMEPGEDARGSLRVDALGKTQLYESKQHYVYRFPYPQRLKVTKNADQDFALKTMISRLTKKTMNLCNEQLEIEAERMFKKIQEHFEFNVDKQILDKCFMDAIEKFQARGHTIDDLKDCTSWHEYQAHVVKNHLKAQQKPSLGKNPMAEDKAGQGISAWDKSLNFMVTVWTRALEHVYLNNAKGKVRVISGMSNDDVLAILNSEGSPNDRFFEADWTEFDSSQNNLTRALLIKALKELGCPEIILRDYASMMKSRTIADTFVSLTVNDKKDSGSPHTLVDNCQFNLAVLLDLLIDFDVLYIKGDDSLARGQHLQIDMEKLQSIGKTRGYKLKPVFGNTGEFVSFICSTRGSAYSLPRFASKVLSKSYSSFEEYKTYQIAVADTFLKLNAQSAINMVRVNALHYGRSPEEMDVLLSFLIKFASGEIPFKNTIRTECIAQRVVKKVTTPKKEVKLENIPSIKCNTGSVAASVLDMIM